MGGFCGVVPGVTPVLIVRGAIVLTGEDSREVSERMVVSLTYPSSKSLDVVAVERCCYKGKSRSQHYHSVLYY